MVGLKVATPSGTIELGRAPKSAAGPDLRQLFLGSEGAFGVITELTVEVAPAPATRVYEGWWFESFTAGAAALRKLIQDGPMPTVLRLSDEAETALNLARPGEIGAVTAARPAAASRSSATRARRRTSQARRAAVDGDARRPPARGATRRPARRGHTGATAPRTCATRCSTPGALVETLETATFWSNLDALYAAVGDALRTSARHAPSSSATSRTCTAPARRCTSRSRPRNRTTRWPSGRRQSRPHRTRSSKPAARSPTTTAIGIDHRDHYAREVGPLAIAALKAVKDTLDPNGIMNPGVLI